MAVATVAPNFQVDFLTTFDIGALLLGTVTIATGTTFRITYDNGDYDQFTGTGFVYDVDGVPIDGTLTGITGVRSGVTVYTVTGFTMPATTLVDYAVADDTQGALADIFDGNDSLKGSNFGDYIIGYDGNDTINGAGGDDSMEGGVGNDTYIADSINDFVFEDAGGGSDTIMSSSDYFLDLNVEKLVLTGTAPIGALGNEQDNLIIGNSGNNFIDGDAGDDTLDGGAGNDALFGFTGDDLLIGGAGNDVLLGEEGSDTLQGGTGKDFYVYNPSIDGADVVITGEKGLDFVIFDDTTSGNGLLQFYDWDFDRVGNDLLITAYVDEADADNGFDATQSLRIKDQYAGAGIAFFAVNLGESNSFYTAFSDFTRVFTPGGLVGINQGGDAELIVGTDSGEKISGNGGHTDWLFGEGGNDTIAGGGLAGDSGWLYGGKGNDSLQGGAGNDNLRGDEGNDTLNGGAENPNLETLFLGDRADFRGSADGVTVDLTKQGTPQFVSTDQGTDTLIEIENVRGSDFADIITGDGGRNWLAGRDGNDSLVGNGGADVLEGEGGNDTLTGGAGDDELYGGDGNDLIQGGEGFDFLGGSKGNDTLDGGALEGQDEITYYSDPAGITANLSAGTVKDGYGNTDTLVNIAGVLGSFFNDSMVGNDGYNFFEGNGGDDTLVGGGGSDGLDFFNSDAAVFVDLNTQGVAQQFGPGWGSIWYRDSRRSTARSTTTCWSATARTTSSSATAGSTVSPATPATTRCAANRDSTRWPAATARTWRIIGGPPRASPSISTSRVRS